VNKWIKGTNTVILSLAVIGIFIVLTVFLHSLKGAQWDLTKNKKFTLADQTVTALSNLDKPVHAIAFSDPGQGVVNRQITDMLGEYHKRSSKFTYEEVDPKKKPSLAQKYKVDQYGSIVFESGGKTKTVSGYSLFGNGNGTYTFSGEEKFTQAILSLSSGESHTVYFLTGHGEQTSSSASVLRQSLEGEGYTVKDVNLLKDTAIPADAETLFVLAPQQDLSPKEAELIQAYEKGKGKLMVFLGVAGGMDKWTNWNGVLDGIGVRNEKALALESQATLMADPLTIIPAYGSHDITSKLKDQNRVVVLPEALALSVNKNNANFTATALLTTSDQGFGKTNLAELATKNLTEADLQKTAADLKGPLDLAYAVQTKDNKPKAVVIGNGVFMLDDVIGMQGNRDFILNSAGWLQGQQNAITIRPQEEAQLQQIVLTPRQNNAIFTGTVVVVPALFLLAGGLIWWRRRKG
jgi:ABC-type uncharacterized transport system involved in gliding motility auxiliary subunit